LTRLTSSASSKGLVKRIWKEAIDHEIVGDIPHMPYDVAMSDYGSDRPDLRFGMKLVDITDLAHTTDFGVFKNAELVKCVVVKGGAKMTRKETDALAEWAKTYGAKGLAVTKVVNGKFDTGVAKFVQPIEAKLIERTGAAEGDLIAFAADKSKIVHKVLGEFRLKIARDLNLEPSSKYAFVWVVDFPMFEYDDEEKRFVAIHHPFTTCKDEDVEKLDSSDLAVIAGMKSKAYDIVCNGYEIGGGSIRIHRMDLQQKVFKLLGITPEQQTGKFGFLLEALSFGAPPHGGLGDRRRPARDAAARHHQHPRRHRLPQNPERRRPDVRRARPRRR
jgi:aspartyl-tRNA synthetase